MTASGRVKVRGVPAGRADEVRAQTEAEPVGHTAKSALSLARLAALLRRLDARFADPETVPFSPVCCPGSPVVARCEVAGLADSASARPATPPHYCKRGHAMSATKKGTWEDPAIISDSRINDQDATVRAVAQRLHGNESMHLHEYVSSIICPYCALRTSRVLRWAAEHDAGREMRHDTPFGLVASEVKP